jgi:predicted ATPase/class 3 adenylate cyclase
MISTLPTGVVTLVFTDIEGSSELWEQHRAAFQPVLERHNELVREVAGGWSGVEVNTEGDAFFLAFARASDAVRFAVDVQERLAVESWPVDEGGAPIAVRVRIGLHTGEPLAMRDTPETWDYQGPAVNRAARVGAAAHGGQVLCSEATRVLAAPELPEEIEFRDLGQHRLKGVGQEMLWQVCHPRLPRDFPPLRTLDQRRHNLPLPMTPFIGRAEELLEWGAVLRDRAHRIVTLAGFGGLGKTRTALQLAELCLDQFPGGAWWVALEEARTADAMVERIAHSLHLALQPHPSAAEQLRDYLRERDLLLVLDNTEQIQEAAAVVQDLVRAAPRLTILVTTRRPLALAAEQVIEIHPLPATDAERLFMERARARRADFAAVPEEVADVAELCARLEGVPLAIELAASRAAGLTPRDLLDRITERFQILKSRSPDLPPRQRALRGMIDWSYELLTEEDRSLFAQLSVFSGDFTLDDVEAVCDVFDPLEGVLELRQHSFLSARTDPVTRQMRYVMLEAVREYAAERLAEDLELRSSARRRHADRFLRFARERIARIRSPEESAALRQLEIALPNVQGARDWTQESGQHAALAELCLVLGTFLARRGLGDEALAQVRAGIEAAACDPVMAAGPIAAHLRRELAGLHLDRHEWDAATAVATEAVAAFERLGDRRGVADATNLLGMAARGRREYGPARRLYHSALALYQELGDQTGIAVVMNNLGTIEYHDPDGDHQSAARFWQESLRLHRERQDRRGTGEGLNNVGCLAQEEGRLEEAWRYYGEALRIDQELGHTFGVARAVSNLGEVAEARAETAAAIRLYQAAVTLFRRIGSPLAEYSGERLAALEPGSLPETLSRLPVEELVRWAVEGAAQEPVEQ